MSGQKDYFVHESACVGEPCQIGKGTKIWHFSHVMADASLGEKCILGQNVHVAGDVVTKDVPDYALMIGSPARQKGWISRHGIPLKDPNEKGFMICAESGYRYKEVEPGVLKCLDLDEEMPLPAEMAIAKKP